MKNLLIFGCLLLFIGVTIAPPLYADISEQNNEEHSLLSNGNRWEYDEETGTWRIEFPAQPLHESVVLSFVMGCAVKEVAVIFSHEYLFPHYDDDEQTYDSQGSVEVSHDSGETWEVVDVFQGRTTRPMRDFYLTPSQSLQVRFTVEGVGHNCSSEQEGYWCIWDIDLIGDTRGDPPDSIASTIAHGEHWYQSPLTITIRATDGMGVKEIHYILKRQETIVPGNTAKVFIPQSGVYEKFGYWAVDNLGNEETPNINPTFYIDMEEPTVKIILPEPGLILFGKNLPWSINKTIIIGGFTVKVNAFDKTSGVYRVRCYLDDKHFTDLTEEPYTIYYGIKHCGSATLKVVAEDFAGHTCQDTLDIIYYNFF